MYSPTASTLFNDYHKQDMKKITQTNNEQQMGNNNFKLAIMLVLK